MKNWCETEIEEIIEVTDYVANGSFATLKQNVEVVESPNYAYLIRLIDFNRNAL